MEDLLVKILFVIEHNMNRKLEKLEILMKKNKRDFRAVLEQKDILQGKIMKFYCLDNSDTSLTKQISFMFRIIQQDYEDKSPFHFDVSREDAFSVIGQRVDPPCSSFLFNFSRSFLLLI